MMKLSEIKQLLNKYEIHAKKKLGQNFLVDDNVLNKISNIINSPSSSVIEIGPGLGSLTTKLIEKYHKVLCYELDSDMVTIIKDNYLSSKLIVLHQDFLKSNVEEDIDKYLKTEEVILVANLPYYITTMILTKIIEEVPRIKQMVVMMQKEVAERICGVPSTKDYNSLSVLMQFFTEAKILFNVARQSFYPIPNVDSSVVLITRRKSFSFQPVNLPFFLQFNRVIFSQRRKTLANNIYHQFSFNKDLIDEVLKENDLLSNVRAEELTVNTIIKLSNDFYQRLNN